MRRDIKSVALLAQVLSKQAAAEAGAGEAWMIEDGKVTEGGSSSAFILTHDDVLVTRNNSSAILPGCTRKAVYRRQRQTGPDDGSLARDLCGFRPRHGAVIGLQALVFGWLRSIRKSPGSSGALLR
jgi:hypothetical protein